MLEFESKQSFNQLTFNFIQRVIPIVDIGYIIIITTFSHNHLYTFLACVAVVVFNVTWSKFHPHSKNTPEIIRALVSAPMLALIMYVSGPDSPAWILGGTAIIATSFAVRDKRLKLSLYPVYVLAIGLGCYLAGSSFSVIISGMGLLSALAITFYNLFELLNAQNERIVTQNELITEKQKEIIDSINYAQRIQNAILPPDRIMKQHLVDSFVLFKPKDIVAGDFYWMEAVGEQIIFAAADCTGHGVPGAMLSMLCNNALNRSVREYSLTDPGQILDKTREIIIAEFEAADEHVQDGMDISLCVLNGKKLQFAGAYNPLWIVRGGEVTELKGDRQPIGNCDNPCNFTTQHYDLESGDTFYIFSDGYVDQFGGEKGKKLKSKAFREILLAGIDKPMDEQRDILDEKLTAWRGAIEQVDDVCVIGVKV